MWKQNGNGDWKGRYGNLLLYSAAFGIVFVLVWLFFYRCEYAPFGGYSAAWNDADIQYLDFFAYFKDVLSGANDIGYTFSKELGGTNLGTFSYYLASPWNVLVAFFEKTEMETFFDLLVSLKISFAAATAAVFFRNRFSAGLKNRYVLFLSVGYALMQYTIVQCSNIMWLDGVYMLPLILLGVYRLVHKKTVHFLSISVGLAIVFNWYSAGMDCLFAIVWFFFELFFAGDGQRERAFQAKEAFFLTIRFGVSMLLGVMLSAVLFLPTIAVMRDSSEGTFQWELIKNEWIGNVTSAVQNYVLGATSSKGSVALFCGSLAVVGSICFFISKAVPVRKKLVGGALLGVSLLFCYWMPFVVAFSLLKSVESYWYRYSYVSAVPLLFLAASYFASARKGEGRESFLAVKSAAVFAAAVMGLNYVKPTWDTKEVYTSAAFLLATGFLVEWPSLRDAARGMAKGAGAGRIASVLLAFVVCLEMFTNLNWLSRYSRSDQVELFREYTSQAVEQTEAIQAWDGGQYRISHTANRRMGSDGLTAYYNGAMAYNYHSITEYTSAPDGRQTDFLTRLGYRCEGADMQIVNTSIVGADALLGVKYIASPYPIEGLTPVDELGVYNGKTVYENPYSLPMAFLFDPMEGAADADGSNPFAYQNALYSKLLGEQVEIYKKLDYEKSEQDGAVIYTIDTPSGNYAVYGNLPWNAEMDAKITINESVRFSYSRWLSQSVFYIPPSETDAKRTVKLRAETVDLRDEQFYALDLDLLGRVTKALSEGEAQGIAIENGTISGSVEAAEGQSLFLSVPYHSGWSISRNGETVEPELIGDCLISIPLHSGTNQIEMTYRVPMLWQGAVVSVLGAGILGIPWGYRRWKRRAGKRLGTTR